MNCHNATGDWKLSIMVWYTYYDVINDQSKILHQLVFCRLGIIFLTVLIGTTFCMCKPISYFFVIIEWSCIFCWIISNRAKNCLLGFYNTLDVHIILVFFLSRFLTWWLIFFFNYPHVKIKSAKQVFVFL